MIRGGNTMQKKIAAICNEYVEEENFSGVVFVKTESKVLYEQAYGLAHIGFNIPNQLETKFDTASITKLFTAVATLQLIDKKRLHMDEKIHDILSLEDTKIDKNVTVYHLLTHTSGIGDDADEEAGEDYEELWRDQPNYSVRETVDYLPQFVNKEPNFKPGEECRYNNCAYILLGLIIEKRTGEKYRDYVEQSIFNKIGMNNTGFYAMDGIVKQAAEHYVSITNDEDEVIGLRKNIYSYPAIGSADAGALSTVEDLDTFIRSLKAGELLSEEMTAAIFHPQETNEAHTVITEKNGYGFEFIVRNETEEVIYMQKDGVNAGVGCVVTYYPGTDMTIIILANRDANVWDLAWDIQELFITDI